MQFEKAHLSQSNRTEACFFGQQGMPSAICMACPSAAGAMVAARAEGAAAIGGAAGPITTPTAIPSAKNQRMAARSFMAAKSHRRDGLRSPMILNLEPVGGRSHHALVRGDGPHPKAALRPIAPYPHIARWKRCSEGHLRHGRENKPADLCAGLRYGPLVSKEWFSFAGPWLKEMRRAQNQALINDTRSNSEDAGERNSHIRGE